MSAGRRIASGLGWAAAITFSEWFARRAVRSRARAWLVVYAVIGAAALASGARLARRSDGLSLPGLLLAATGYPAGRSLLRDVPAGPPPDSIALELAAIEVVAVAEELSWGALVEPALGRTATAALFAAKHVAIDGRWRRGPGLFAFWIGLGMQRRRWPAAAFAAHLVLNAGAVLQGQLTGRDRF